MLGKLQVPPADTKMNNSSSISHNKRLLELDAIRGLAALGIVLFHYTSSYKWPTDHIYYYFRYLEEFVQVFFIISGFVILMSFTKIKRTLDFIVGRFARLYPGYWISVATTIVIVYVLNLAQPRTENLFDILANFSMFHDFIGAKNINIVYWTLTLELAFYGIVIFLYKAKLLRKIDFIFGIWLTVILLDTLKANLALNSLDFSLASSFLVGNGDHFKSAYSAQNISVNAGLAWDTLGFLKDYIKNNFILIRGKASLFIAGVMLYQGWKFGFVPHRVIMIIVCILVKALDYSPDTPWYACLFFTSFVLVIYLAITNRLKALAIKPLVFLGSISYALYLTHLQVSWVSGKFLSLSDMPPEIVILAQVILAILIATIITRVIEEPAMKYIKRFYKKRFA